MDITGGGAPDSQRSHANPETHGVSGFGIVGTVGVCFSQISCDQFDAPVRKKLRQRIGTHADKAFEGVGKGVYTRFGGDVLWQVFRQTKGGQVYI